MPFVPIINGAEAEIQLTLFDRPCQLTLHFLNRSPPTTTAQLSLLANTVGLWFRDNPLAHLSVNLFARQVDVFDASSAGNPVITSVSFAAVGADPNRSVSANVAAVISFVPFQGAAIRPNRNYIPGVPITQITGSHVHQAFLTSMRLAYSNLIDAADANGWRWICVHRFHAGVPLSFAAVARVDLPVFFRTSVGQRRRRLRNSF